MSYNSISLTRSVYNLSNLYNDMGAFYGSIHATVGILLYLFSGWSLEKHLIYQLFRKSEKNENQRGSPIDDLEFHLKRRKSIKPTKLPKIFDIFKELIVSWIKKINIRGKEWHFKRA